MDTMNLILFSTTAVLAVFYIARRRNRLKNEDYPRPSFRSGAGELSAHRRSCRRELGAWRNTACSLFQALATLAALVSGSGVTTLAA